MYNRYHSYMREFVCILLRKIFFFVGNSLCLRILSMISCSIKHILFHSAFTYVNIIQYYNVIHHIICKLMLRCLNEKVLRSISKSVQCWMPTEWVDFEFWVFYSSGIFYFDWSKNTENRKQFYHFYLFVLLWCRVQL